jgi:hypothetical protein
VLETVTQQISNLYILGKYIISVELFLITNYLDLKRSVLKFTAIQASKHCDIFKNFTLEVKTENSHRTINL